MIYSFIYLFIYLFIFCVFFQETVNNARQKDTAVFRSGITDVDTTVAQERDAEEDGVQSLQTTGKTNSGDTAEEEEDVRFHSIVLRLHGTVVRIVYLLLLFIQNISPFLIG